MSVLLEFDDAEGDWVRVEEVPAYMGEPPRTLEILAAGEIWLTPEQAGVLGVTLLKWAGRSGGAVGPVSREKLAAMSPSERDRMIAWLAHPAEGVAP